MEFVIYINALIKYDVISGKSKNVLSIEKPMEQMIYVDDDFLEITNINPEYVLRLDETDCEILEEINNKSKSLYYRICTSITIFSI